jgi:hypothetical protein
MKKSAVNSRFFFFSFLFSLVVVSLLQKGSGEETWQIFTQHG